MTTRSHGKSVAFSHSFELKGVDRLLPPGEYRVVTDEELIEELSFSVYRRVATMIIVPVDSHRASSVEMVTIDPLDLQEDRARGQDERRAGMGGVFGRPEKRRRCRPQRAHACAA